MLGTFKDSPRETTRAGEATRAELAGSRFLGKEQFHRWVDSDPAQALAFLGLAGSSVPLMKELHPDIRRLREREHATGATAAISGGEASGPYKTIPRPKRMRQGSPPTNRPAASTQRRSMHRRSTSGC